MTPALQRPEAISLQCAARILSVSESTVRRWIRGGYLEAVRTGPRLLRIPKDELARFRASRAARI
jgi:excisionase family DNA binding protein